MKKLLSICNKSTYYQVSESGLVLQERDSGEKVFKQGSFDRNGKLQNYKNSAPINMYAEVLFKNGNREFISNSYSAPLYLAKIEKGERLISCNGGIKSVHYFASGVKVGS